MRCLQKQCQGRRFGITENSQQNVKKLRLGIGFATGRKSFSRVLNAYAASWNFSMKNENMPNIELSLFVAYDTDYNHTQTTDYTNLPQDIVDLFEDITFSGIKDSRKRTERYCREYGLSEQDSSFLFDNGYAGKRNRILLAAVEKGVDYLLFLDDDEYPIAVTQGDHQCLWSGQRIFRQHLDSITHADITCGYHCGYVSPIPRITFNEKLSMDSFKDFIYAISNDAVKWDSIYKLMEHGGVTYADKEMLIKNEPFEEVEKNHCKFISGSNLCINLTRPERVFPFFNPPEARGEDTFLSTLLSGRSVLRVPVYTFHDGFQEYRQLLTGALPIRLNPITANSKTVKKRFYNACIGWIRYKPLLMYLTNRESFESNVREITESFSHTLPQLCDYFEMDDFMNIMPEFMKYVRNVGKHADRFLKTQQLWAEMMKSVKHVS